MNTISIEGLTVLRAVSREARLRFDQALGRAEDRDPSQVELALARAGDQAPQQTAAQLHQDQRVRKEEQDREARERAPRAYIMTQRTQAAGGGSER